MMMNRLVVCWLGISLLLPESTLALSQGEQQTLTAADQHLRQIENNLQLARESAGPGESLPPPAKAKLAGVRLGQAAAALPAVEAALATIKGDEQAVKTVRERLASATAAMQQLQDRLAGKAAVVPSVASAPTTSPPTATGQAKKLDYRQEEQLRGADFNVREGEGSAQALVELVERLRSVQDLATIDYRQAATGMNTIANAERKLDFAEKTLKNLPIDGAGVAELRQRLDAARVSLASSSQFLRPLNEKLQALIAPSNYPALADDLRRLREFSTMYGNPAVFQSHRREAAVLLQQQEAVQAEVKRLTATYGPLIGQKTEAGNQLEGGMKSFTTNFTAFLAAAEQSRKGLPGEIRQELATAERLAEDASTQQNVLPFVGGIPEHIERAEEKLALLQLLDANASRPLQEEIGKTRSSLAARQTTLEDLIVKETPPPADRYSGSDRQNLADRAAASWRERQPAAKILRTVFPAEQWHRTTRWEYANGTWTYVDFSRLQAQLLVAHDGQKAVIRPINLTKDHQKNDEIRAVPLDGPGEALVPQRYVLLAKVK